MDNNLYAPVRQGPTGAAGQPLVILGPGPSYDLVPTPWETPAWVFALNCAITDIWPHRADAFWVSNDHDRTWGSQAIRGQVPPRVKDWRNWVTITNRKFIPGEMGDIDWLDHRGHMQGPMDWRLPLPSGSVVWWYEETPKRENFVRNGHSCLELALEVATLWGFGPIVLIGCDMHFESAETYYAKPFRYKSIPPRIEGHKMRPQRQSIIDNRHRWSSDIKIISELWQDSPFENIKPSELRDVVPWPECWRQPRCKISGLTSKT